MRLLLPCLALLAHSTAALADAPRVVTDIPAVHALVAEVLGDAGAPVLLLDKGADEHHYQMRPSQARALQDADLLVWIGPELTPWLARAGAETPQLQLLAAEGTTLREYGAGEHDHEAEEHEDHEGTDPHAWLAPQNAVLWLGLIAAELGRIDPENGALYRVRAAAGQVRIAALDGEIAAQLAGISDKPFVVYHDAYGYFTEHYGLSNAGSLAEGDAAAPGAARLSELRAALQEGQVVCIFPEAQLDPGQVAIMAEGTGVRIGAALDATGSASEPGPGLYDAILRGLAGTLVDCLAAP